MATIKRDPRVDDQGAYYPGYRLWSTNGRLLGKIAERPEEGPRLYFEYQFESYAELKETLRTLAEAMPED